MRKFFINHKYITFFILAIILTLPYFFTLNYPFQYDDYPTIFEDSSNLGLQNILHIRPSERPIRKISLIIDRTFFGNKVIFYRIENLILYIFSIFLLGIFVFLITDEFYFSIISMLIFAIHPIHVSTLMIVTHRKELFLTIFSLLAFISHIKKQYKIAIIFFILSVLSKETAIVLPILFILYDKVFNKNINKKYYYSYLGLIGFGIIVVVFFYSKSGFYLPGFSNMQTFLDENRIFRNIKYYELILIQPYIFIMYFIKLFIPYNLNIDYYVPLHFSISLIKIITFIMFTVYFYTIYYFRKNKMILFGLLFFIIMYLPVSNIIPVTNLLSDRYMFFTLVSVFFIYYVLFKKYTYFKHVLIILSIIYLIISLNYIKVFENEIKLWTYVTNRNPKSVVGNNNLGIFYMENGDFTKGEIYLKKAYNLDTLYTNSIINLASLYGKEKQYKKAKDLYYRAIQIEDYNTKAYYNLALTYLKEGNADSAKVILEKLLNMSPKSTVPLNMLGALYYQDGLYFEKDFNIFNSIYIFGFSTTLLYETVQSYEYADSIFNIGIKIEPDFERLKKNIEIVNKKIIRE